MISGFIHSSLGAVASGHNVGALPVKHQHLLSSLILRLHTILDLPCFQETIESLQHDLNVVCLSAISGFSTTPSYWEP